MALYRTITGKQPCGQCQQQFTNDVQFRTGDNDDLQSYTANSPILPGDDLPTKVQYMGIGNFYCPACTHTRQQMETEFFYDTLSQLIGEQTLVIKSGLLIKTSWTKNDTEKQKQKAIKQLALNQTSNKPKPHSLFKDFHKLNLIWQNEAASQGNMAYTNLIETINQTIKQQFQAKGWHHHGLLRHDIIVSVNEKRVIGITIPEQREAGLATEKELTTHNA